jgi:hypothetical protein
VGASRQFIPHLIQSSRSLFGDTGVKNVLPAFFKIIKSMSATRSGNGGLKPVAAFCGWFFICRVVA